MVGLVTFLIFILNTCISMYMLVQLALVNYSLALFCERELRLHMHVHVHVHTLGLCVHVRAHINTFIGERERANLVVQLARFFYIYIYLRALHIPYISKCFYALLFHRHLSTFHGTHL